MPVNRVSKFLEMLEDDIKFGTRNQVKDFFLKEIKFAQDKIGQSNLFDASVEETHQIDKLQLKKKVNRNSMNLNHLNIDNPAK